MGEKSSNSAPPPYESIVKSLPSKRTHTLMDNQCNTNLHEEQPLTPSELIKLKDGYDEKRRAAYETAYTIGCANYIKYINDKLKKSNNEVYIDVHVYISMQEKPLLPILNEYRCKTYDTQLVNKVNKHIKKAYEAFGVTVIPGDVIGFGDTLRIKIPQTVTPFN